jgi:ferredoxin
MPNFEQNYNRVRRAPKIEINHGKCPTPLACRKCAMACPQAVFYIDRGAPLPRLAEFDVNDPGKYVLGTICDYACTGCNDCMDVCPSGAITITWP